MNPAAAIVRFTAFAGVDMDEIEELKTLAGPMKRYARGETIQAEGDPATDCYLLLDGWTASNITFADGTRQMLKVHLPGDVLGMPSLALTHSVDTIRALTPVAVRSMPVRSFGRMFESNPRLAALLFLIAQEERVNLIDRIAAIGGLPAIGRVAALLLQIHARLKRSDPGVGDCFELPLAQFDIAELVGITTVHTNRVFQQLREDGIASWSRKEVRFLDKERLRELAGLPPRLLRRDPSWLPRKSEAPGQKLRA